MDDLNISKEINKNFPSSNKQEVHYDQEVTYKGITYKVILPSEEKIGAQKINALAESVISAINPKTKGLITIEKNQVTFENSEGKKTVYAFEDISRLKQEIHRESEKFSENAKTIHPKILTQQLEGKKERLKVCEKIFEAAFKTPTSPLLQKDIQPIKNNIIKESRKPPLPPLFQAILKDDLAGVKSLIKSGININQPIDGISPIEFAIKNHKVSFAKELVGLGAKIKKSERLFKAIAERDLKAIDVLVNIGCKLEKKKNGMTPLDFALLHRKFDVALKLKDSGAKLIQSQTVKEMLYKAIWEYGGDLGTLNFFKELGVNFNDLIISDSFPLTEAIANGNKRVADWLIKKGGADPKPAEKTVASRLLAHVWGVKGNYNQTYRGQTVEISLEGFTRYYSLNQMASGLKAFNASHPPKDSNHEKLLLIQKTLEEATTKHLTPKQAMQKIQAGEPYVICGGFTGHAVTYTFCEGKLFVGNRGMRDPSHQAGIEIYELPKEKVTEELLAALQKFDHASPAAFEEKFKKFQLKHLDTIQQKVQKVGNCTWASSKSAFFALMIGLSKEKDIQKAVKDTKPLYKQFTLHERVAKLRTYVPEKDDGLWPGIAHKMVKQFAKFAKEHNIKEIPPSLQVQENTFKRQIAYVLRLFTDDYDLTNAPPCSFEEFQQMLQDFKKASDPFFKPAS